MISNCIVVGNSPRFDNMSDVIDSFDFIIRTGEPKLTEDTGFKTNMLITRGTSMHVVDENISTALKYRACITEAQNKKLPSDILFLSDQEVSNTQTILLDCDTQLKFKDNEKPTLGIIALMYAKLLNVPISIAGIETDYDSVFISRGHYGDIEHIRENRHHSMIKELLWLNNQIKSGSINLLNSVSNNK